MRDVFSVVVAVTGGFGFALMATLLIVRVSTFLLGLSSSLLAAAAAASLGSFVDLEDVLSLPDEEFLPEEPLFEPPSDEPLEEFFGLACPLCAV